MPVYAEPQVLDEYPVCRFLILFCLTKGLQIGELKKLAYCQLYSSFSLFKTKASSYRFVSLTCDRRLPRSDLRDDADLHLDHLAGVGLRYRDDQILVCE